VISSSTNYVAPPTPALGDTLKPPTDGVQFINSTLPLAHYLVHYQSFPCP
jgi:hypothetical protein